MPDLILVGRLLRPHGVRGELVVEILDNAIAALDDVETVYLGEPPEPHRLERARWHRGRLLIRLDGFINRDAVERFRGQLLRIDGSEAPPPPGEYRSYQLLGLTVVTEQGEVLGEVTEIIKTGANDVYVVSGAGGEILLPAIPDVIRRIDLDARRMTVHLLEGLR